MAFVAIMMIKIRFWEILMPDRSAVRSLESFVLTLSASVLTSVVDYVVDAGNLMNRASSRVPLPHTNPLERRVPHDSGASSE